MQWKSLWDSDDNSGSRFPLVIGSWISNFGGLGWWQVPLQTGAIIARFWDFRSCSMGFPIDHFLRIAFWAFLCSFSKNQSIQAKIACFFVETAQIELCSL